MGNKYKIINYSAPPYLPEGEGNQSTGITAEKSVGRKLIPFGEFGRGYS